MKRSVQKSHGRQSPTDGQTQTDLFISDGRLALRLFLVRGEPFETLGRFVRAYGHGKPDVCLGVFVAGLQQGESRVEQEMSANAACLGLVRCSLGMAPPSRVSGTADRSGRVATYVDPRIVGESGERRVQRPVHLRGRALEEPATAWSSSPPPPPSPPVRLERP